MKTITEEQIIELINNKPYNGNFDDSNPYKQAVINIFNLFNVIEIIVHYTANDSFFEWDEVDIKSRTYDMTATYMKYEKEMQQVNQIIKDYLDHEPDIEINEHSDNNYIGEKGNIILTLSDNKSDIVIEKYGMEYYTSTLEFIIEKDIIDNDDLKILSQNIREHSNNNVGQISPYLIEKYKEYSKTNDEALRQEILEKISERIIRNDIFVDKILSKKELFELSEVLLKYIVIADEKAKEKIKELIDDDYVPNNWEAYDPLVYTTYLKGNKEEYTVLQIRYVVNIIAYENLNELMNLKFVVESV